jgi:beta-lactamase class A
LFFKSIGLAATELGRKMMDLDAIKAGKNNYTTAADMGRLMKMAAEGTLLSRQISETIVETMTRQFYTSKLPALLPATPSSAPAEEKWNPKPGMVTVANKTGDLPKTEHDTGVFILPGGKRYVIAMLTSELESEKEGAACIAKVSRAVYEALSR